MNLDFDTFHKVESIIAKLNRECLYVTPDEMKYLKKNIDKYFQVIVARQRNHRSGEL